jgi:DNA-binding MarR family transcriptional regulator
MSQDQIHTICSNAALRRASRRVGQLYDDVLESSGLRATQYSLLSQIARSDGASMGALAATMVMDRSALGHTLAPLTRAGLVELVADSKDRRSKRVVLTEVGQARLEAARPLWRNAQARFDTAFGGQEAAELRFVLARIGSAEFARSFTSEPSGG